MPAEPVDVITSAELDDRTRDDVTALLARAEQTDGAPPLNEAGLLNLRGARPGVLHVRAHRGAKTEDAEILGYAQLDGGTGQVVVDPAVRRQGVGTALLQTLRDRAGDALHVWAVGDTPAASGLARRVGLVPVRTLLVMTRPLADLPPAVVPDGFRIDTFDPEADGPAWLAVNRRAFAHHPEQGAITADDLKARVEQPWFDPDGFFLARRTGGPHEPHDSVAGFHWTKRHPDGLGEVYVIGVDPDAEGRGLAKALLLTGLAYLRERGDTVVELYVEADSARAVGLYESRGFAISNHDVMYGAARQP